MSNRLQGKVAVITGGASGIGEATARAFVEEGASVVIADLQAGVGEALARELGRARFVATDVTSETEVERAITRAVEVFGRIDCLVNSAGLVGAVGSIREIPAEAWNRTLAVLLNGVFFGIKHAARRMVEQRGGVIVSVASVAGVMGGLGPLAYTAAKHAVIGLTKGVAAELAPSGVRVNAVAPGVTVTPMIVGVRGSQEAALAGAVEASPLGTALLPEEIAAAIVYLASDDARHVTGHTLVVDSGVTVASPTSKLVDRPAAFVDATVRGPA